MISNELFQIAGLFHRYEKTGGVVSAAEAAQLSAKLGMLAEGVLHTETALKALSEEFDRYIEDQCSDRPGITARPRHARYAEFAVIDGGLAEVQPA